jgi:hypothetical protein
MESCMRAYYTCCSPVLRCLGFLLALVSVCWCSWCVVVLALQGGIYWREERRCSVFYIQAGRCYAVRLCSSQQAVKKPKRERERPQAFRWWNAVQDDRQPASLDVGRTAPRGRVRGHRWAGLGWARASRSRFVCIITSDRLGQTTRPGTGRQAAP